MANLFTDTLTKKHHFLCYSVSARVFVAVWRYGCGATSDIYGCLMFCSDAAEIYFAIIINFGESEN